MTSTDRALASDLIAYYEQEVAVGRRTELPDHRVRVHDRFVALLRAEGRSSVVDLGSGPGLDTERFVARGFDAVGVDLAPANAVAMGERGLRGVAASLFSPPFQPASFDAAWTMSTLVHVPDDRFDDALAAIIALVPIGAPIAVGTWGGFDFEGVSEFGDIRPYRFFALRNHDRLERMLAAHGDIERFETSRPNPESDWSDWEYQFALLRRA